MSRRIWFRSLSAAAAVALVAAASPQAYGGAPAPASSVQASSVRAASAAINPDGTTTVVLDVTADSWVNSLGPTASQLSSPELQVGSTNLGLSKSRSYLDFDYTPLQDVPTGSVVTSAELKLSNFATGACAGTAVRMSRVTAAWTQSALAWSKQPAVTTTGSSTSTASYGASACPAEGTVTFDATAIASAWLGGATRAGVQIKADKESAASAYRKFRSLENADAAKAPTMTVTYDAYPETPTGLTVTPGENSYASSLTPTFTAVVTDPDGGPVHGFFEVRAGTTPSSPIVWSGSSDPVESGEPASVTVPDGVLTDGTIYSVAAYGHDGVLKSKTPAAKGFKVDVTAPTMVITSNPFKDGQWLTAMPSTSTFTLNGSADTGRFHVTFDGADLGSVAANSSGDFSVTWKPTAGWHVVEAVPVDKAGNEGEKVTFSFGTGYAAFTAPTEWEASTSSFPVYMSGPPNATGATLSWRVAGETSWHVATQVTSNDAAWDGSVLGETGRSTTGELVWNATDETLGSGTLTAPALVQLRGCFHYAGAADTCTADRFLQLVAE